MSAAIRTRTGIVVALAALLLGAVPAAAQQRDTAELRRRAEQELGPGATAEQVLERLRASGLSRSQVRARLQALGYDPGIVDAYFDALAAQDSVAPGAATPHQVSAVLDRLGVPELPDSLRYMLGDSVLADSIRRDSLLLVLDSLLADSARLDSLRREARLPIFGMDLFRGLNTQFTPLTWGPVGPDYRLGPGDELVLILTGDVEVAYDLQVTREGFVVIPDVGQMQVAGLTLGQLESRLYDRLGRVYSGVERGPDATTRFQVSLGALRMNQVYLVGEVQRPGAYQVSAVSTVVNALYEANGPTRNGSFRNVQVLRGNELVTTVDLYEYLMTGVSSSDVRLENGDRVFVPLVEHRVSIDGAVRRTGRYEMKGGETLRDLIAFAGGFRPEAIVARVQIDRVLPPEERRPGVDRVLIDVPVASLAGAGDVELRDGDAVTVFTVGDERRNRVVIEGEVRRPGVYEWQPGMTLEQLLNHAEGLAEAAYTQRAQIYRLDRSTGLRYLTATGLDPEAAGGAGADVVLADLDSVVVYSRRELAVPDSVEIAGFVKRPGRYPYVARMSVQDLILAAGGFTEGANLLEAELARRPDPTQRTDTAAIVYRVLLADTGVAVEAARAGADRMIPGFLDQSSDAVLAPGDRVLIGQAAGYLPTRTVIVAGEVAAPGPYALTSRDADLRDVLRRAGGLTEHAYVDGFQLIRDSSIVGVDLGKVLRGDVRVPLEDGDSLYVPRFDATVYVSGAVGFESRVLYREGAGLGYYIEQAGGYSREADRKRTSVTYANGQRETVRRFLFFSNAPEPGPGSRVFVPSLPPDVREGVTWTQVVQSTTAILGTVATLIFAYTQLTN